ncbi:MAG: nucleotidyl transferase AbiEii/AbiGii toxin family protein [Bacteroidales bacterium]
MLQTNTIEPATLELLRSLLGKAYLQHFNLAGGTALALYLGHRTSIDLDLITNASFDEQNLMASLQQDYTLTLLYAASGTLKTIINDVNVDILIHKYPNLENPLVTEHIRLCSEPDIIAMKLNAISVSGQRSKDFIDIYYALKQYDVGRMLSFYQQKYSQPGDMHILKSIIYFDDADLSDWPVLLKDPDLRWEQVKERIEKAVLAFIRERP